MCSLLQPQAVLLETDGTYVAPSVGLIPASASPRDVNLHRRDFFFKRNSDCNTYSPPTPPPPPTHPCSPALPPNQRSSASRLLYSTCSLPLLSSPLPVWELRAPLVSAPKPDVIFMTLANRAEGRRKTPGRLRQSSVFLPL